MRVFRRQPGDLGRATKRQTRREVAVAGANRSRVVNATVLPLHIATLLLLAGHADIMGEARSSSGARVRGWISFALVLACLGGMVWSGLS